jgi:microcystin-dependent protein
MAEGMAPSAVNDGIRALMASAAKWRDDITGITATTGSGTAYALTSNQTIAANTNGFTVQFTPGTTNTGAVTLSVDSQTAKPLRFLTGVDLPSGVLISGSLYQATYRSAVEEWLLHSFDASIYAIPVGACVDYFGATAPNGSFVLPYGQAISRTTYSALFTLFSTTFGSGDGSTTFNVPDLRGRVTAGKDDMGGTSANRLTDADDGLNGDTLGDTGGGETQVLVAGNLPSITSSGTNSITVTSSSPNGGLSVPVGVVSSRVTEGGGTNTIDGQSVSALTSTGNNSISVTSTGTSSTAFGVVQPTIICNKLLRIL